MKDSFLGHFCLENRNPCYYTGLPKGARIHHLENLKNRTLIFEAPDTRLYRVARPFDSFASGEGLSPWTLCMFYLVTMIYTLNYESWLRSPRDLCGGL